MYINVNSILSPELRIALVLAAVGTMVYFLRQISRSRMQIDSAVSWSVFSGVMVLFSLFPDIMMYFARLVGIESPSNLVFLLVFAVLIFQQFFATTKISKLEQQIASLTQAIALKEQEEKENR